MEEDVWSVMEAHELTEENAWTAHSLQTSGGERRRNGNRDDLDERRKKHVATSAPINNKAADVDDGDWESEMVRRHEYMSRSRNGDGGSSGVSGVGKTLKGRDMRRVRDASLEPDGVLMVKLGT
ncbi:protein S40-6 [Raphanus sativus]|uniref:Protein S40-6 n=1 Tax=Raphanus sativus TaxID=3726 RepID=A0A6J0LS21_RAPSA|nr:protein S40-6 [Raphanus sativus]